MERVTIIDQSMLRGIFSIVRKKYFIDDPGLTIAPLVEKEFNGKVIFQDVLHYSINYTVVVGVEVSTPTFYFLLLKLSL